MREVVSAFGELGIEHVDVDVARSNTVAHALYARWGLRDEVVVMTAAISDLDDRLGRTMTASSFGSAHVQSDDMTAVEKAVREFVPRLPGRIARVRDRAAPERLDRASTTTSATAIRRCSSV